MRQFLNAILWLQQLDKMTKKKEKRAGARSEPAKGAAGKDSVDNNSAMDDAARIHPKEVFDSSKYNAMSEMTKGSNRETRNVETLADAQQATNSVKPEPIDNESITRTTTASASSSSLSYQSGKEKKKFVLFLNIMLSIENAAIERLHTRIQQSPLAEVREQLVQHLEETREQKSRLITLIQRLGGQPTNERAVLSGYALPKVLEDAFKASATTLEEQELRTIATDALIEYAEVIGYNMAIQLATRINIGEAIMPLRQNLQEEEKMVAWMRANLPSNFLQLWSKIDHEQRSQ